MDKARKAVLFFGVLCLLLSGCGKENTETEDMVFSNEDVEKIEESQEKQPLYQEEEAEEAEESQEEQPLYQEDGKSYIIQEDENYIYVCGIYKIVKINKETKESVTLWETAKVSDGLKMYPFCAGRGLLAGEKIYFIEGWTEGTGDGYTPNKAISVIHTDGTGYERIVQPDKLYDSASMLLQDGILYVEAYDEIISYKVYEDGTLCGEAVREKKKERDDLPEGCKEPDYYDNGYRLLFASESMKKFGGVILENGLSLVEWIPETGEMFDLSQYGSNLKAFNSRYFLISSYDDGSYLVDTATLEGSRFTDDSMIGVIAMDEDYVYTETKVYEEGQIQYIYEKISLETAERSVIFRKEESKTAYSQYGYNLIDVVVKGGYLYYADEMDYKLYLMRRSVDDPSVEECLGEAFYDSGISEVGTMETCHERFEAPGVKVDIDLEWLQVDSRFPGADKINKYLAEDQKRNYDDEKELLEKYRKTEQEGDEPSGGEEEFTLYCSYTSEFSEISYFDGHYLSFYQSEDRYESGMGHGSLYQIGYAFDLQTGERLMLSDVIENSEEELKDIVIRYFGETIQANPEYYWEYALSEVEKSTSFEDSLFYLTKEGIRFYFGPYALASFAAGFQEVTIPYEEFEMKIVTDGI
ncbi:MAG: DUF3298 domain-containing protein [Lachnospiraceae bacterium]|nr:DUF3298 domain-containing protein [Lachnospiraceae bacterium]